MKTFANSRRTESGAAVAELAILVPVCALMLVGSADFGGIAYHAMRVQNAARAGVDYGSRDTTAAADLAGVESAINDDLGAWRDGRVVDVAVDTYCNCGGGVAIDCAAATCMDGVTTPRTYVEVEVSSLYIPLLDYPGLPGQLSIARSAARRAR